MIELFFTVAAIERDEAGFPEVEWVWAAPLTDGRARVDSIPYFTEAFCRGDVVEHHGGRIVRVVEHNARTVRGTFEPAGAEEEMRRRLRAIRDHFAAHRIDLEHLGNGIIVLGVPPAVDSLLLLVIAWACPHGIVLYRPTSGAVDPTFN
jgi:hypothetical protein